MKYYTVIVYRKQFYHKTHKDDANIARYNQYIGLFDNNAMMVSRYRKCG